MSLTIIIRTCFSLIFLIPLILQPLSLGLCIIVLTILYSLLISLSSSSWYGYILFLVFIGGLLVIFAYVSVLAPNTFFTDAKPILILLLVFISTAFITNNFSSQDSHNTAHPTRDTGFSQYLSRTGTDLIKINSTSLAIILGVILLIALLAVVKICLHQQGPLQPYANIK